MSQPSQHDADRNAIADFPQLCRLIDLRGETEWFFQDIHRDGERVLVIGARLWPDGSSEAIAIGDVDDAKAYRCDAAGGLVWTREGGMAEVIDALLDLPAPSEPDAPRLVLGSAPKRWTPTDGRR